MKIHKILFLIIFILFFMPKINAASFCSSILNSPSPFSSQNILLFAFLIMLMMTFVIAITYLIGYSFKIDRLVKFSKSEFGEIIVTGIIIAVIGGLMGIANTSVSNNNQSTASIQNLNTVYTRICNNFYQGSLNTIANVKTLLVSNVFLQLISALTFNFEPFTQNFFEKIGYGVGVGWEPSSFTPFSGLGMIYGVFMTNLIGVDMGLSVIQIIISFLLAIFFAMLPIFFYLGIVFRAFPWTRAIGGTFIALFIAFYLAFPMIIFAMLMPPCNPTPGASNSCISLAQLVTGSPTGTFSNAISSMTFSFNPVSLVTQFITGWNWSGFMEDFNSIIYNTIAPAIYNIFAIIVAFIISYDLLEGLGDLLGAPSLSSKHALKKLI
ncbi:MAG: hypothetical protein ACP5RI_03450 [Candidatus Micrarchaeia archaeon]